MSDVVQDPPSCANPAFSSGWLDVGHGHRIYYQQAGAEDGICVLALHGGPGSGASVRQRQFFDLRRYRVVQFDQRGCGRSEPAGEVAHNHTGALVADIEALRTHLEIDRWLVFGGSWGAALALAYAGTNAGHVSGLILRGTFLTGNRDLEWFFHGVRAMAPQANDRFMQQIPRRWRRSVVTYLDRRFSRTDDEASVRLAAHWQAYESALNGVRPDVLPALPDFAAVPVALRNKYRVQAHYLARKCFLGEGSVLRAAAGLGRVPVAIVHGTHDLVCRPANAWRLHRRCAGSRLAWAAQAGHDPYHPASLQLLLGASGYFAEHGDFSAWPGSGEGGG